MDVFWNGVQIETVPITFEKLIYSSLFKRTERSLYDLRASHLAALEHIFRKWIKKQLKNVAICGIIK